MNTLLTWIIALIMTFLAVPLTICLREMLLAGGYLT